MNKTKKQISMELGCKENEVVDLTDALKTYSKKATEEFFENLNKSNVMEMSFNRGEVIIVKVEEEDLSSTKDDIKYVVEILYIINEQDGPYHKVGEKRWVRVYNLKKVGHYQNEVYQMEEN